MYFVICVIFVLAVAMESNVLAADSNACDLNFSSDVSILSSKDQMIDSLAVRAAVWFMAIFAVFGNLGVLVHERKELQLPSIASGTASMRSDHILVMNLAASDLVMGLYSLILAIQSAIYNSQFCNFELQWLASSTCTAMGVFVVISVESSLLTMLYMTYSRLYIMLWPESERFPKKSLLQILIAVSWIVPLIIATIPLSPNFQSSFVHEPTMVQTGGSNLTSIFGFYGASTVCMPKHYVTMSDSVWRYALSIPISILTAFVLALPAIVYILYKSHTSKQTNDDEVQVREIRRKIMRLVITDFFCWVPYSIVVFVYFSGAPISSFSYAVGASIHLPLKSATNPIFYLKIFDRLAERRRNRRMRRNMNL